MKTVHVMESRTAVLLTALAIGCGLALHPFFFLVAIGVVLIVALQWTTIEMRRFLAHFRRRHHFAHG